MAMNLIRLFLSFLFFFQATTSILLAPNKPVGCTMEGPINQLPNGKTGRFIYHEDGLVAFKVTPKDPKEEPTYTGSLIEAIVHSAAKPIQGYAKRFSTPPIIFNKSTKYANDSDFWQAVLKETKKRPSYSRFFKGLPGTNDFSELQGLKEAYEAKDKQRRSKKKNSLNAFLNTHLLEQPSYIKSYMGYPDYDIPKATDADFHPKVKNILRSYYNESLRKHISDSFLDQTSKQILSLQNMNIEIQHKGFKKTLVNKFLDLKKNVTNIIFKEKCIAKKKLAEEFKKSLDSLANGKILSDSEIKKLAEKFFAAGNSLLTKAINDSTAASQEFKDSLNNPLAQDLLKSLNPSMTEEESEEFFDDSVEEDFFEDDSDNLPEDSDEKSDEEDDQNKNNPSVTPGKPKTTENADSDSKDKETEDPIKSPDSDSKTENPETTDDTDQKDSQNQDSTDTNPTDAKPKPEPTSNLAKIGKGCGYALLIVACCWGIKKLHSLALESKDSKKEDSKKNTNKDKNVSQDSEEVEDE